MDGASINSSIGIAPAPVNIVLPQAVKMEIKLSFRSFPVKKYLKKQPVVGNTLSRCSTTTLLLLNEV
jgi:hypothetical protein